jgi:5-formyltetrahydrofolate cyclo-ligase
MMADDVRQGASARIQQRQEGICARERLSQELRAAYSQRAVRRVLESPEFENARIILSYRAVKGELSLDGLDEPAEKLGKSIAYPLCTSRTEMVALLPGSADSWQKGAFGILEPVLEKSSLVAPEDIDLVLCPCTAFDEDGNRVGMGAGYYDRYLPACTKASIAAVAFEAQKTDRVLAAGWDHPMQAVFTESACYGCGKDTGAQEP